jgi:hypothetical protein
MSAKRKTLQVTFTVNKRPKLEKCTYCNAERKSKGIIGSSHWFCDQKCMAAYLDKVKCSQCDSLATRTYDGLSFCKGTCRETYHDSCPTCKQTAVKMRLGADSSRRCANNHHWRMCDTHGRKTLVDDADCDCVARGAEPTDEELYDFQALMLKEANEQQWQRVLLDSLLAHVGLTRQEATQQLRTWLQGLDS